MHQIYTILGERLGVEVVHDIPDIEGTIQGQIRRLNWCQVHPPNNGVRVLIGNLNGPFTFTRQIFRWGSNLNRSRDPQFDSGGYL